MNSETNKQSNYTLMLFSNRSELFKWASEKKPIYYEGKVHGFYIFEDTYKISLSDDISKYYKVVPKKAKRFWLWNVEDISSKLIRKTTVYLDDDGYPTSEFIDKKNIKNKYFTGNNLVSKFENEYVDIFIEDVDYE